MEDNDVITQRLAIQEAKILTAIGEVKQVAESANGHAEKAYAEAKAAKDKAQANAVSIALIQGEMPGLIKQVDKVEGWFIKMLMTAVAGGGAAGTLAAVLLEVLKK